MVRKAFVFSLALALSAPVAADECVVLLHGMARSEKSMAKMADRLAEEGYQVVNYGYPSTSFPIEHLASTHVPQAVSQCGDATPVNFVTHSLGGILVRKYLSENTLDNLGRVVMLGPPNQGSEVVDKLKDVPGFHMINGPAGAQLGTEPDSVPNSIGPVTYPVGVVAGSSSINLILSQMLPDPDDGKVSVERTKVEGMADHLVLPVSHPFLMRDDEVIRQAKAFLETGQFAAATTPGPKQVRRSTLDDKRQVR